MAARAERFALFVDAGYLYAAGGELVYGTVDRSRLRLSPELPAALAGRCTEIEPLSHLRTYWYDAAENLIPTPSQLELAALPGVKLRLGRLTASRHGQTQKGVDSAIVRDMIKLSVERAISTAFLFSGDEDLKSGLTEAQDYGVRVVVMGVQPAGESSVSIALVREADDVVLLDRGFLAPHIALLAEMPAEGDGRPTAQIAQRFAGDQVSVDLAVAFESGRRRGFNWLANASSSEINALNAGYPKIPSELDRDLLFGLLEEQRIPPGARLDFESRRELRSGFWSAVRQSELSPA
jgi:uncharacterized LabA/DUF88 family protein